MLKIENVRVSYNGIDAVHGVSLEVSEGEAVALLGPNGAGKSSTLKRLSVLLRRPAVSSSTEASIVASPMLGARG